MFGVNLHGTGCQTVFESSQGKQAQRPGTTATTRGAAATYDSNVQYRTHRTKHVRWGPVDTARHAIGCICW